MDDLLFALLDLAFDLIGEFWPVILAYLGYKLFGGLGKRMSQGQPEGKPVRRMSAGPDLTPVEGGGFPSRVERKAEPVEALKQELPVSQDGDRHLYTDAVSAVLPSDEAVDHFSQPAAEVDAPVGIPNPREGLKWALIFSPPRAKAPYRPPYRS
jgi:hypothetical protein